MTAAEQRFPVSYMQRMYHFLYDALEGPVAPLHASGAFYFVGRVDMEALVKSFAATCTHHQALAARFHFDDGVIEQSFDGPPPELPFSDLADLPADERLREAARLVDRCCTQRFDFAQGDAAIRGHLVRLAADEVVLAVVVHHVVSDLRSLQIVHDTLLSFYRHFAFSAPAPEVSGSFAAYLEAETAGANDEPKQTFWRETLATAPPIGRPSTTTLDWFEEPLEHDFRNAVVADAKRLGVRNYSVLLARHSRVLARWFARRDVTIGIITLNRAPAFADTVGCLAQWLPVRVCVEPGDSFEDAVKVCHTALDHATTHTLPLGAITRAVRRPRLFDMALCANWISGLARSGVVEPSERVLSLARAITPEGRRRFAGERTGDLEIAHFAVPQRMSQFTLGLWTFSRSVVCHHDPSLLSAHDARELVRAFAAP